jgi:nitrilase
MKIAIVQKKPVYLDLNGSMELAAECFGQAASRGANLVVFGETWLTGYPTWMNFCPDFASWGYQPTKEVLLQMWKNGIEVPGKETEIFCELAKKHNIAIVIGINEIVRKGAGNGTIYNSALTINEKGEIANHHRKLMPTYTEKLLYGHGDGNGLNSVETSFGRLGSLICWEHWMPHARQAMHNAGEDIHVALWPSVHDIHQLASRHYAFEGRCYVVAVGQMLHAKDLPGNLQIPDEIRSSPDKIVRDGGSCVYAPDGSVLLEPQFDRDEIIYFEIENFDEVIKEHITLDVTGHYSRQDVFEFEVNKNR